MFILENIVTGSSERKEYDKSINPGFAMVMHGFHQGTHPFTLAVSNAEMRLCSLL